MASPRAANLIAGVIVTAVGTWTWFHSRGFPTLRDGYPGPALFPGILALLLVACGVGLMVHAAMRPRELRRSLAAVRPDWPRLGELAVIAGLGFAYPLLRSYLGFLPTSVVLIFGVSAILGARWYVAAAVAVAGAVVIYLAFTRFLGVPL